ncbi:WD40 repeat domain-containing serine/threonine protein kinase [Nonomuraea sp. NPDC005983]|uniref:WD40 repeat domain-containing serine/threonine protein kinase n=1 Tax=Nonomuraea sp. NPDC005983 TaxID=3155595 RepID=UPI0033B5F6AA
MEALIPGDPQRLGGYWLAGRLGAGGQGVVYEAYAENGARVAIKVLHGDQAAQLAKEAAAAQRVSSFCTARVIEAVLDGPRPYLVSEYVPGPSLREAISEGRPFNDGDLHRLATAVATALTAIHEAGVVHRDLKPDNVLLGPDGPRVIDFGIARTAEMSLTATGLVTGTPTYMAPEVFSGKRAGQPADVFAWGGIMLYAATGTDPFEAESLGGVMHRVLSSNPDLSVLPEPMRSLVRAALMKDPRERPSARQLLLALVSGDSRLDTARLLAQGGRTAAQMAGPGDDPALGALAEESYALLGPAERELVPEVLLRLVTVDGEHDELAVRHAGLAEFIEGRPAPEVAAITRIMEVFGYLLGRDHQEVWLAHPVLPHAWPRLRRWIEANRDGLAAHRQIRSGAQQWNQAGRKDGDLLQSTSLDSALQWAATYRRNITLSPVERDFLESSVRVTRRRARRARLVTLSLAGLLVIALTGGGLAVWQSMEADAKAVQLATALRSSESIRLAALADATSRWDPRLGMLLSVAAWRLAGTTQARTALNGALAQREQAMFRNSAGGAGALTYFAADGRTLVSLHGGRARLLDVRSGRQVAAVTGVILGGGPVTDLELALSPSGRTLLVANDEQAGAWDVRTGKAVGTWPTPRLSDRITRWAEAVARNEGTRVSVYAGRRWEVVPAERSSRTGVVSPDGRWRASQVRGRLVLTDLRKGSAQRPGEGIDDDGDPVFSRDGRLLATVSRTSIRFWRLPGLQPLTKVQVRGDGDAAVWPIGAFDGSTFRYLMGDQVFSLDVADLTAEAGRKPVSQAVLSGDGRYLVVSNIDDAITVRSLANGKALPAMPGPVAFAFSPHSRLAVVYEGRTRVLDPATGKVLADFAAGRGSWEVAFSPDGRRLALLLPTGPGHAVELWDWAARRRLWRTPTAEPTALAFSPDGRRLAVVGRDQRLLDTASGRPLGQPFGEIGAGESGTESGTEAWFTRSGTILIVHDSLGRVTRWDTATRRSVGLPVRGVFGTGAAYSPAEDLIAFPQSQGRVLLFDPLSGSTIGRSADTGGGLDPATGKVWSAAFSPDGSRVLTADGHATVRSFPAAPEAAAQAVCTRAGRSLTRQEWAEYVPALPYLEVCPR